MNDDAARKSSGAPEVCDILIRNGYVLTLDPKRTVYASGAIAITGNRIVAVGPERDVSPRFRPRRVLDAEGAPVHPGMIDAHIHASVHLARTVFADSPAEAPKSGFADWFINLTDEDEHASCMAACVEMARNGFTGAMEAGSIFEPDVFAQAAEAVGVRISLTDPYVWDVNDGGAKLSARLERAPANPQRARAVMGRELRRNQNREGTVHAHIGLYGSGSASLELELEAKRMADANGVVFSQHQNFTPEQAALDSARLGGLDGSTILRFAELGILGPNTTFVHMNILRDEEIKPVVDSGMSIVWQPGNYQFYGIASRQKSRMAELLGRGVNIAMGVDVAKLWTFGDMARVAYLVARQANEYISCETLFEMQTIGAARALGLHDIIGSLEPGKRADIVIRTNDVVEAQPGFDVLLQILMLSQSRSVDTVLCNGEIILRNGRLTRVDESAVNRLSAASANRMMNRIGAKPRSNWPVIR